MRNGLLGICFLISIGLFAQTNKEKTGQNDGQKSYNGTPGSKPTKAADISECPQHVKVNPQGFEVFTPVYVPQAKASLVRSTQTRSLNTITLKDIHLNVPSFKQFNNNKTDFTADGEVEFQSLVERIGAFISTDNSGKDINLHITGSASQIPTSFDPSKAYNNLRPDGSSIPGQTSVENNKLLAKARADELAKKLRAIFPKIKITSPKLEEIKLGEKQWTYEVQRALIEANKKKDKVAKEKVFEPFQKDQWVMVESNDITTKSIQPEALKMYMMSTTPSLKAKVDGKEQKINTIFIVSKNTFNKVGKNHSFGSVGERDKFIRRLNLKIFNLDKDSLSRWYLLAGGAEQNAFNIADYKEKIGKMYDLGIADVADHALIDAHIRDKVEMLYR
jgi:hypothetical protein